MWPECQAGLRSGYRPPMPLAFPSGSLPFTRRQPPGPGRRRGRIPGGDPRQWGVMQRPEAGTIPDAPGSYQFKDARGRVLYVGKAKSLRSRLANYFGPPVSLMPRTRQMVAAAETVEWIEVR